MRQRDAAEHAQELLHMRSELEQRCRQVLAAETDAAKLRLELEAEQQRVKEAQGSLASMAWALEQQRQTEAAVRSHSERLESALLVAKASVSAVNRQGVLKVDQSMESLVARAERAETALVATEAALSALKSGQQRCSLIDEAECAQLHHRLERAEALNAALEKRLSQVISAPSRVDTQGDSGGGRTRQPSTPKASGPANEASTPPSTAAVTTTFGTPCGVTPPQSDAAAPVCLTISGSHIVRPTWDGQYLSSPKRGRRPPGLLPLDGSPGQDDEKLGDEDQAMCQDDDVKAEKLMEDDGLPPPPSSRCWDWPLSKPEKQERVAMMDAQILLYDQRGLIDEVEALRGVCVQHGLVPPHSSAAASDTCMAASILD